MSNKRSDYRSRLAEIPSRLYIIAGALLLAGYTVICTYTDLSPASIGLIFTLTYAVFCLIVFLINRRKIAIYNAESAIEDEQNNGVIATFRDSLDIPYAVITRSGNIVTLNSALKDITGNRDSYFNLDISELCDFDLNSLITSSEKKSEIPSANSDTEYSSESSEPHKKMIATVIDKRKFNVLCYPIKSKGHTYFMLVFDDITKLTEITDIYYAQTPAVAYVVIDNLDEIAQYVKGSYRAQANQVENILKDFVTDMNGVIREYDRDKYMLIFDRKHLNLCIKNKFSILDEIRKVCIGDDNIPVTISMGVAITGNTLAEREHDALACLDTALQRGGDQVVVKNDKGINYFGGMVKSQQKRTKVHSRIIANKLFSEISNASNVIVMGHGNPDFDSIGACVGIASLAMYLGVDVRIVSDTKNANFKACTENIITLDEYKNVFIDHVEALDKCTFGTLVVIVDANNFAILEAPEIASQPLKKVVIDHHIKKEAFSEEPTLTYIDPSASSACELVSEILENCLPAGTLKKEEATILLSGIMVDTKNFTRTVGTRTFAAALYLRSSGANSETARTFFSEEFEDYRSEALFGAGVEIFRDRCAITTSEGTGSAHDRVAAAKAADKLLTVRQVDAAFALVKVGDAVHISARSNGTINVQLILEKIGGGGHFDMAGASLSGGELSEAKELLLGAIDAYFSNIKQ